eukprot:6080153-Lingulodinium_polyedra.AAC.1
MANAWPIHGQVVAIAWPSHGHVVANSRPSREQSTESYTAIERAPNAALTERPTIGRTDRKR